MTIVIAILVFGAVVLFHEFGHFIVAKMCGVRVHEFSIGMGPKLTSIKADETEYSIRIFPLGGFIRMEGEDENSNDPKSFGKQSILERISIIFAGPFMNFILAILLFFVIFLNVGVPSTTIEKVQPNLPAYETGLKAGDDIISINNEKVKGWDDITQKISSSNSVVHMKIERDNNEIEYDIPLIEKDGRKIIGIQPTNEKTIVGSLKYSVDRCVSMLKEMLMVLVSLVTGNAASGAVAGPIGIISAVGQVAKTGILNILSFTAIISLNLGLFNLLPIPALDGSRILFLIIEGIRGKKISAEKEGSIHFVGFVALMLLMLIVTYKDVLRLIN